MVLHPRLGIVARTLVVGLGLCAAWPSPAHAEPTAPSKPSAPSGKALFAEAQKLLAAGKVTEACAKLAESDTLEPKLTVAMARARCERRAKRDGSALLAWRDVEGRAAAAKDAGAQRAARAEIASLEKSAPKLAMTIDPQTAGLADAAITIDGRILERATWTSPQPVDLGRHHVEATAPGRKAFATDVDVASTGASLAIPALEDASPARFVELRGPQTIDHIGAARWEGGFGFVLPTGQAPADDDGRATAAPSGGAPAPVDAAQAAPRVPELQSLRLPGFFFAMTVGASSYDATGKNGTGFATGDAGIAFEYAYRERDSLFVPWGSVAANAGMPFDSSSGLGSIFGGAGRLGLEVHPARQRWFGVGPTAGFGGTFYNPKSGDGGSAVGPQLGLSARMRTAETSDKPSTVDAELYLVQRWAGDGGALYGGANAVLGRPFLAYIEGRVSQSSTTSTSSVTNIDTYAQSFPAAVRGGVGLSF